MVIPLVSWLTCFSVLHNNCFPSPVVFFSTRAVTLTFILKRQNEDFLIVLTPTPTDAGLKAAVRLPATELV